MPVEGLACVAGPGRQIHRCANRVTIGMITAALIVGGPTPSGWPAPGLPGVVGPAGSGEVLPSSTLPGRR